jgi:hypothetical protein
MISDERLQKALKYLAETDEPCAKAKSLLVGLEHQLKTVKSMSFTNVMGTMAEKDAQAYSSQSYKDHVAKIEQATYDFEMLRNKRLTEELIIECWRSLNANRRKGNI